jgi:hypothetical protein
MANLIDELFAEPDPIKVDELISRIVKDASANPAGWEDVLPPAVAEAERQAAEAYEASTNAKRTAWLYIEGHKGGGISDEDLLKAKAAAFDADEVWVRWIAISGDLQDLAQLIAKQPRREYVQ